MAAAHELFLPPDHDPRRASNEHPAHTQANGHGISLIGDPDISWPLERSGETRPFPPKLEERLRSDSPATVTDQRIPLRELAPGERRSQSGIAARSFFLGITLGLCILLSLHAALELEVSPPTPVWRIWFLLGVLSLWHFLEFWTHAQYNVPKAYIYSFLLFNNGWQHTAANAATLLETIITSVFFPEWQERLSKQYLQWIGLLMLVFGQVIRSMAMAQAGTSFNHQVQTRRSQDHTLITTGVYRYLRHPSYFGFFWWAIGLQLVLGNATCFAVYLWVLWNFFRRRISHEEKHLISFFGDDYVTYREKTWVGIPFIK